MNRRDFLQLTSLLTLPIPFKLFAQENAIYRIPPTLLGITENTARVHFRLVDEPVNGVLTLLQDGEVVQEIPLKNDDKVQTLMIDGLSPTTWYDYQITVNDLMPQAQATELQWEPLSFRTPPYGRPLRFVAIGDSGREEPVTAELGRLMAQHDLHMFLHLGDFVYGSSDYSENIYVNWWRKYFSPFQSVLRHVPHYPAFGNHELDEGSQNGRTYAYDAMFPSPQDGNFNRWYSFMMDGIRFISINTQVYFDFPDLVEAQERWLDELMLQTDSVYTVAFFHISPFSSGHKHDEAGEVIAEKIIPRLEQGNVKLVLSGHEHSYERLYRNGIHYIVSGAGSNNLYEVVETSEFSQVAHRVPCYPLIECYDEHIDITTYNAEGEIIDQARLE